MKAQLQAAFTRLNPRERLMVYGAVAFTAAALVYFLIWTPLFVHQAEARARAGEQRTLLAWMRDSATQVQMLRANGASASPAASGLSLLTLVDQTVKQGTLVKAVQRVEPVGTDGARVWFENADFDALVLWLGQLKQTGVNVESLTLERTETAGRVTGRVALQGAGGA